MSDLQLQADGGAYDATVGPLALYVHIPFCETKCPYCDFNTYAGIDTLIPGYVAALRQEIGIWGRVLRHPTVETVFFGGGTPSYLPAEQIESLMAVIGSAFDVVPGAEVTLEANPDDITPSKLAAYQEIGINRLSIGVQTLNDDLLKVLGRRHSAAQAVQAYRMAKYAGFTNASIDLMYGLPHQETEDWKRTLESAVELDPPHVSMYCLTLEKGTPMAGLVESGRLPEPDQDLAAEMYFMAQEAMLVREYRHYEISNWARPGFESRHNLTYWRNRPYLGVGPGAHSYLAGLRFSTHRSPVKYVSQLRDSQQSLPSHGSIGQEAVKSVPTVDAIEEIDRRLEMAETMMMGLRLDTGISVKGFTGRFAAEPTGVYGGIIEDLTSLGLLETVDGSLRLTPRGRIMGNEVFSRFFE